MLDQVLILIGAAIFGLLGTIHLFFLYRTNNFFARDRDVVTVMQRTALVLTPDTTMWRAWLGFNASHSVGLLLVAIFYLLLASTHMDVIRQTPAFITLAVITSFIYLYLAHRYWFRAPFIGIASATICFLIAAVLIFRY